MDLLPKVISELHWQIKSFDNTNAQITHRAGAVWVLSLHLVCLFGVAALSLGWFFSVLWLLLTCSTPSFLRAEGRDPSSRAEPCPFGRPFNRGTPLLKITYHLHTLFHGGGRPKPQPNTTLAHYITYRCVDARTIIRTINYQILKPTIRSLGVVTYDRSYTYTLLSTADINTSKSVYIRAWNLVKRSHNLVNVTRFKKPMAMPHTCVLIRLKLWANSGLMIPR